MLKCIETHGRKAMGVTTVSKLSAVYKSLDKAANKCHYEETRRVGSNRA